MIIRYPTTEHFMMADKARTFGDEQTLAEILAVPSPAQAKTLGRKVRNFDTVVWAEHRFDIVVAANRAKFGQDEELRAYLLGTKDRVLVEASPVDRIWGIGLAADDVRAEQPGQWRGLNLLGFALMEVRRELADDTPG
ncbi:NADAR family protein [Kribbella sp. NPDC056345]|uniref:NADAR family protein n=1 Tax=Kribbella sp. NPDC056345 TaxID=3345789 RepID=UPI0035D8B15F